MSTVNEERVVLYHTRDKIAFITLNRPHRFNAIDMDMPLQIKEAVDKANQNPAVKVIILQGAGNAFCSGYDLKIFAEAPRPCPGSQNMPWDPLIDYQFMRGFTDHFMSLWKSLKPVICKVHGAGAIAGGSDIALCCDIVLMDENSCIGYPPARVWGCPTTMMWVYRVGAEKAKRMLLTGDVVSGKEAEQMGLVWKAVPTDQLDAEVLKLAERMTSVPLNQLMMHKLVVNQAYENMGMNSTQNMATLFDGIARHSPEGVVFKAVVEKVGFKAAVKERDRPSAKL